MRAWPIPKRAWRPLNPTWPRFNPCWGPPQFGGGQTQATLGRAQARVPPAANLTSQSLGSAKPDLGQCQSPTPTGPSKSSPLGAGTRTCQTGACAQTRDGLWISVADIRYPLGDIRQCQRMRMSPFP
ncbi:uncharacterized protein PGTG_16311 [Puccinia graminis f. sp. tritici CRL 75-36-700-3]|uniref:Uncharacterized protein n=1 Tax=Puccinia graminis f. sp. tritici (strain CRL 75-36-700-3 / race SCCL) TaxID=418459 RepID=E3L190_PUCGT|nr:uncharacterized protein PGTG_16311 [Puccinia graminis f. sp. tritici CRL 75-36-700-3]EFP90285.2 hypothetical protein PGTG_16311 [Puccinia graminis f. sp. tritici CRL 75-36-700-3]